MTEKTEEQIERERVAVASLKNAQSNMTRVIERVDTLEYALRRAIEALKRAKGYVPAEAYGYPSGGQARRLHVMIDEDIAAAQKVL